MNEPRHRGPNPFDSGALTLAEAFPEIADLTVEVEQYEYGSSGGRGAKRKHVLKRDRIGQPIRCDNPSCWKGGFDLHGMLLEMVAARSAEAERSAICGGSERSPQGRRVYSAHCGNHFKVCVQITYVRD